MEPTIEQKRALVQQEFARRQAGQMPSSAGIGASTVNDPLMGMPPEAQTTQPQVSGGAAGTPSDGTIAGMKQQKGEAQKLTDALIFRQKKLTERGE